MIGKKGLLVYIVVAYNIDLHLNNYAVLLESFVSFSFSFKPGCCTGKASKELISYTSEFPLSYMYAVGSWNVWDCGLLFYLLLAVSVKSLLLS
jgi:hypothetical protein